jgi:TolB-like protein
MDFADVGRDCRAWFSGGAPVGLGFRANAARNQADGVGRRRSQAFSQPRLDLHCGDRGALSIGLFFLGRYTAGNRMPRQSASAARTGAATVPQKSIAVLPFESLSEDKSNGFFADGIQDEILARLSKIADLKVISRTSTQRFKSAPSDLPEIAAKLGVSNVLEGSVQKSGDAVRVTVQLIQAANDSHLWAETYDRKLSDVFGVETEIAQRIASSLEAKLTGREKEAIASVGTKNPQAYEFYLRGLSQRNKSSLPDTRKRIENYRRAVELNPGYVDA